MKKLLFIILFCILSTVSTFAQYSQEPGETYVGQVRGKYPLTVAGLQDAIASVDSGVIYIAYPGLLDTSGVGAIPSNVYLSGWYQGNLMQSTIYSSANNITQPFDALEVTNDASIGGDLEVNGDTQVNGIMKGRYLDLSGTSTRLSLNTANTAMYTDESGNVEILSNGETVFWIRPDGAEVDRPHQLVTQHIADYEDGKYITIGDYDAFEDKDVVMEIGDADSVGNKTLIVIDDSNKKILLKSDSVRVDGNLYMPGNKNLFMGDNSEFSAGVTSGNTYLYGVQGTLAAGYQNKANIIWGNDYIDFITSYKYRWTIRDNGEFRPYYDSDVDIGTDSYRVKNIYTDTLDVDGDADIGGNLDIDGDVDIDGNFVLVSPENTGIITLTAGENTDMVFTVQDNGIIKLTAPGHSELVVGDDSTSLFGETLYLGHDSGTVDILNDLDVDGDADIGGNLDIDGAITVMSGELQILKVMEYDEEWVILMGDPETGEGVVVSPEGLSVFIGDEEICGIGEGGYQGQYLYLEAQDIAADDSEGEGNAINVNCPLVNVSAVTNDVNDFVYLPALVNCPDGYMVRITNGSGGNCELRTPSTSGVTINGVDSDGTNELLLAVNSVTEVRKLGGSTGFTAESYLSTGGVAVNVTPD